LSGGVLNFGKSDLVVGQGPRASRTGESWMSMTGGAITLGGTLSIAPERFTDLPSAVTISGGTFNIGQGIDVGRGSAPGSPSRDAYGMLVVDGTAKVVIGNSLGEGNAAGVGGVGELTVGRNSSGTGRVFVQGKGVVKALRLIGGGATQMTIKDDAQVYIVNTLGAGTPAAAAYSSALAGRSHLWVQGNGLLDVDANAAGRDATRPELQGLQVAGSNSIVDVWDNARLVVRQRLVIGGVGTGANLNGYDGQAECGVGTGAGTVWVTGGVVSADQIVVGAGGKGELDVLGGRVETKAYNATYDPTANGGAGSATTSVNAIRVGMLFGTQGILSVWGKGTVSTGELVIGHYGSGTLSIDQAGLQPGPGTIEATDVVFQKFAGSTAKFAQTFLGPTATTVRARNDVRIKGGTLAMVARDLAPGAYRWEVLTADSDQDGAGGVTGRFTTLTGSETSSTGVPASGRVFSVVYEPKRVVVGFSYAGDGDYSGAVNFDDLILLAKNYNKVGVQWTEGEFTGDGVVNFDDLLVLAKNYNKGLPAPGDVPGASAAFEADVAAAFAAAVPEPGAMGVVGIGLMTMAGARRRRRA
jgi:hypothetical protein